MAKGKAAAKTPVSAHPAFPAIVALWFAALFGIGSLVLPAALYERTFETTGIASLFTAAQAPLGVSARIAIALAASLAGVVAGVTVARKVIAANAPRPVSRRAAQFSAPSAREAAGAKRPISAHDELGPGGIDAHDASDAAREAIRGRRRALAMTDESARSDFLEFAPLPGERLPFEHDEPAALDLAPYAPGLDASDAGEDQSENEPHAFGSAGLSASPAVDARAGMIEEPAMPAPTPHALSTAERSAFAGPAATVFAPAPGGEPAIAELVARFARALESRRSAQPDIAEPAEPAAPEVPAAEAPSLFAEPAAPRSADVPLALRPIGFDDDEGEEDALPDLDLTAALSRGSSPFAAPLATEASITEEPAFDEPEIDPDRSDEDADENAYSSLLAMKSPFANPREPVRIDDDEDGDEIDGFEPVVVFPGQAVRGTAVPAAGGTARDAVAHIAGARPFDAPGARAESAANGAVAPSLQRANGGDTERALREALDKLQKMSGLG